MHRGKDILKDSDNPSQNIPDEYKYHLVRRGLELANTVEKKINTHFLNEFTRYYKMAVEHCRAREYEEAISSFTKCMKIRDYLVRDTAENNNIVDLSDERIIKILIGRGICYFSTGKYLAAAGDFAHVVCIDRQHGRASRYLDKTIEYLQEDIKNLVKLGRERGFLTYDDVNEMLPSDIITSDEIDSIILMIGAKNIDVIDTDKGERIILKHT